MASVQTTSLKVFIDSSVLYAAAYSENSTARQLLLGIYSFPYRICVNEFVLEETRRNLSQDAPDKLSALNILLNYLGAPEEDASKELVLKAAEIVHLKDAPILAGAVHAKATHLASYDKHHLLKHAQKIKERFGIIVCDPARILAVVASD